METARGSREGIIWSIAQIRCTVKQSGKSFVFCSRMILINREALDSAKKQRNRRVPIQIICSQSQVRMEIKSTSNKFVKGKGHRANKEEDSFFILDE